MKKLPAPLLFLVLLVSQVAVLSQPPNVDELFTEANFHGGVAVHLGYGEGSLVIDMAQTKPDTLLHGIEIPCIPILDGMIAQQGNIYISSTDNFLRCFGPSGDRLPVIPRDKLKAYNASKPFDTPDRNRQG